MKLIKTVLLLAFAIAMTLPFGMGKPEYAKKEGKACTFCHPAGKNEGTNPCGAVLQGSQPFLEGYKAPRPVRPNRSVARVGETSCNPALAVRGCFGVSVTTSRPKVHQAGGPQVVEYAPSFIRR